MRKSRRLIVVFLLLFLWAGNYVHTAVHYAFEGESSASITSPDVYLEEGTAGTSVVYPNATSAASQVDSHATTFYPNDYNVTHGQYVSGPTPSSVNQIDADYFTVNSSGSHTSNLVYHPASFTLLNDTSTLFDWGITSSSFTLNFAPTNYRYMGGTSPNIPNMKVTKLYIRTTGAGTVAIALYTGGALNDPTGAVKRTEAYNVAVSAGWNEIDVPDYNWPSDTVSYTTPGALGMLVIFRPPGGGGLRPHQLMQMRRQLCQLTRGQGHSVTTGTQYTLNTRLDPSVI